MKINEIDTNSEQIREILAKEPNVFLKWGISVIFIVICLIFFSFWVIKYPDVIRSQTTITTKIPPQKEHAKITGKLQAILVNDEELVKINQPLAIIENTANYQDVFELKSVIESIETNKKSFSFPIDSLPILFLGDIESNYALFENSYMQYKLNKELKPFSNEAIANTYSISELKMQLKNLKSQKLINDTEIIFEENDLLRYKSLFEKGIISEQDYESKQLEYAQSKRNYKNFETSISQIREAISNAQKNSKSTEISRVREEMILLKNVIQSFNQLKKAIKDWEYLYVLKSNIKGRVSFLNIWTTHQTVSQGDLVFTIIPTENSSYIAKLKTPVQNSGKIKIGQTVNIKLDNYQSFEFGILKGEINNISLTPDGDGLYTIDVKLPEKLITSYNREIEFKQEMTGTSEIITEDLRLIERFFYQFKQIFEW